MSAQHPRIIRRSAPQPTIRPDTEHSMQTTLQVDAGHLDGPARPRGGDWDSANTRIWRGTAAPPQAFDETLPEEAVRARQRLSHGTPPPTTMPPQPAQAPRRRSAPGRRAAVARRRPSFDHDYTVPHGSSWERLDNVLGALEGGTAQTTLAVEARSTPLPPRPAAEQPVTRVRPRIGTPAPEAYRPEAVRRSRPPAPPPGDPRHSSRDRLFQEPAAPPVHASRRGSERLPARAAPLGYDDLLPVAPAPKAEPAEPDWLERADSVAAVDIPPPQKSFYFALPARERWWTTTRIAAAVTTVALLAVSTGAAHRFLEQQAPTLLSLSEPADPPPPGGLRSTLLALAPSEASRSRFSGIAAVVRDRWRDAIWYHPLAGTRLMPDNESRRFGARRQGERPDECGKGHCGVDLGHRSGLPVYAVREGVVVQVVRTIHPKAGRYVRIRHDGGFVTSYLHLQSIRADLRPGSVVRGGEAIATSGRTGIVNAQPHLHFMLAVEYGNKRWHIDPEPLLRTARLPQRGGTQPGPTASVASQLTAQVSELPEDDIDALTDAPEPPRRSRRR